MLTAWTLSVLILSSLITSSNACPSIEEADISVRHITECITNQRHLCDPCHRLSNDSFRNLKQSLARCLSSTDVYVLIDCDHGHLTVDDRRSFDFQLARMMHDHQISIGDRIYTSYAILRLHDLGPRLTPDLQLVFGADFPQRDRAYIVSTIELATAGDEIKDQHRSIVGRNYGESAKTSLEELLTFFGHRKPVWRDAETFPCPCRERNQCKTDSSQLCDPDDLLTPEIERMLSSLIDQNVAEGRLPIVYVAIAREVDDNRLGRFAQRLAMFWSEICHLRNKSKPEILIVVKLGSSFSSAPESVVYHYDRTNHFPQSTREELERFDVRSIDVGSYLIDLIKRLASDFYDIPLRSVDVGYDSGTSAAASVASTNISPKQSSSSQSTEDGHQMLTGTPSAEQNQLNSSFTSGNSQLSSISKSEMTTMAIGSVMVFIIALMAWMCTPPQPKTQTASMKSIKSKSTSTSRR